MTLLDDAFRIDDCLFILGDIILECASLICLRTGIGNPAFLGLKPERKRCRQEYSYFDDICSS
jgi:hypothetical protein